jgi:predicted negative regulator of RcsB-dependent stress response
VVGLALVGGWQGWQQYSQQQAEQAASLYSEFGSTARARRIVPAEEQAKRLQQQFGDSVYAVYATLELAKQAYDTDRPEVAREHLQWALEHAAEPALAQVVRLRLARLLLDQGQRDAARKLVDAAPEDAFAGQFAELRGDLAMVEGDRVAAAAAYQEALAAGSVNADLVRLKLADTGHAPAG